MKYPNIFSQEVLLNKHNQNQSHFVPALSHLNLRNGNPGVRVLVQHFQDQILQVFTDSQPGGNKQASVRGAEFTNDLYLYKLLQFGHFNSFFPWPKMEFVPVSWFLNVFVMMW